MLIKPKNREQVNLFFSIDEMIPGHSDVRVLDFLISEILKENPEKFVYKGQSHTGRPAYSYETMLKLYIYGYLEKISSTRALEKESQRNIELMWLLGDLRPDFKTIADFRKDNKEIIEEFKQTLKNYLIKNKYILGETIAIDGTKLKANANREMLSKSKLIGRLRSINDEIHGYLSKMDDQDQKEEELQQYKELEEGYKSRVRKLEEEKHQLEEKLKLMEDNGLNYLSETDPDCRKMKGRSGNIPGYNGQIAVDMENKMIIDEDITQDYNDLNQLTPRLESIKENTDTVPGKILADAGYCNLDKVEEVEKTGVECYIPNTSQRKDGKIDFIYDEKNDCYYCSQGKKLIKRHTNKKQKNSLVNVYIGTDCKDCSYFKDKSCTKSKIGRNYTRYHNQEWRDSYISRMEEEQSKEWIKQRKAIVEHPFGTIKNWMGQEQLKTRGIVNVRAEFNLWVTVYNLRRLINILKNERNKRANEAQKLHIHRLICKILLISAAVNVMTKKGFF